MSVLLNSHWFKLTMSLGAKFTVFQSGFRHQQVNSNFFPPSKSLHYDVWVNSFNFLFFPSPAGGLVGQGQGFVAS